MIFIGLKLDGTSITYGEKSAIQKPIFVADKITVGPDVLTISIDFAAIHLPEKTATSININWKDLIKTGEMVAILAMQFIPIFHRASILYISGAATGIMFGAMEKDQLIL